MTALAAERVGGVVVTVLGRGAPVTVFAHGLAGTAAEVRPLAARCPGTRVLLTFRGHGASAPLVGGWSYDDLADDLMAVADAYDATRAVGLSLGGGALLRLLAREPARFARLAVVLPAALDRPRGDAAVDRLLRLGAAVSAADEPAVTALLLDEVPPPLRRHGGAQALVARRARALLAGAPPYPRDPSPPLPSLDPLRAVTAPALVVAQRGDPLHPLPLARRLAGALPHACLLTLPPGGVFWTATRTAAQALSAHLTAEAS